MKKLVLLLIMMVGSAPVVWSGELEKIAEIDLRKVLHMGTPLLQHDEHPIGVVSFSPGGDKIAVIVGIHPKAKLVDGKRLVKSFWSDLVVLDSADLERIVVKFEVDEPRFEDESPPVIQWSLDGKRIALGGKVLALQSATYCGRGEVVGFMGAERFLSYIPGEIVSLLGGGDRQVRRLHVVGPDCAQETRVTTHELNWHLGDFSPQRNIGLFVRTFGSLVDRTHDLIAVQFPGGEIVRKWDINGEGRFINQGAGICLGSRVWEAKPQITSSCWEVDTGKKIGDIPANGGFPMMPAASSPRVIVSDLQWQRVPFVDDGRQIVRRRIVWDSSTGQQIVSWRPSLQTYHSGYSGRQREEPYRFALSPDGNLVAEGGDGMLRVYRIVP